MDLVGVEAAANASRAEERTRDRSQPGPGRRLNLMSRHHRGARDPPLSGGNSVQPLEQEAGREGPRGGPTAIAGELWSGTGNQGKSPGVVASRDGTLSSFQDMTQVFEDQPKSRGHGEREEGSSQGRYTSKLSSPEHRGDKERTRRRPHPGRSPLETPREAVREGLVHDGVRQRRKAGPKDDSCMGKPRFGVEGSVQGSVDRVHGMTLSSHSPVRSEGRTHERRGAPCSVVKDDVRPPPSLLGGFELVFPFNDESAKQARMLSESAKAGRTQRPQVTMGFRVWATDDW